MFFRPILKYSFEIWTSLCSLLYFFSGVLIEVIFDSEGGHHEIEYNFLVIQTLIC